jgi:hypothetical protein
MMLIHRFIACWRVALSHVVFYVLLATWPSIAFAAETQTGPKVHSDALPYLLIVLCLALALILLCRSSSRSKDLRLDDLNED